MDNMEGWGNMECKGKVAKRQKKWKKGGKAEERTCDNVRGRGEA